MTRILLFGGTFDPPHRAHTALAEHARRALDCERLVLVPAARNPLKADVEPTDDLHRMEMLRLATLDLPQAEISAVELRRGGVSYFVETLEALREDLGDDDQLWFLIGADQAVVFHEWHEWERILQLASPAVLLRPPWDETRLEAALAESYDEVEVRSWLDHVVTAPVHDVSATDIRRRIRSGEPIDDDVDPAVAAYIAEHRLYRAAPIG